MAYRTYDPLSGMHSPEDVERILRSSFANQGFGGFDVSVEQNRYYDKDRGWTSEEGQYRVSVTHASTPGEKWTGVVRGGPNDTILVRSGEGYQMYIGDTLPVGPSGIAENAPGLPPNTAPYHTGIQSFARRLTAAFGEIADDRRTHGGTTPTSAEFHRPRSVSSVLYKINTTWGDSPQQGYQTPDTEPRPIGMIPSSNVRIDPITSPGGMRFLSQLYNVPIVGDIAKATAAFNQQVRDFGTSASSAWARLHGGGVWRPSTDEKNVGGGGALFVPRSAAGTEYVDEEGNIHVAGLTEKFLKQTYVAERRPVAMPLIATETGLSEVPQEYLRTSSLTMRPDITPHQGVRSQALTSITKLPWQSGQMQFRLPDDLKGYVVGQGGQVMAGTKSHKTINFENVLGLSDLVDRITMDQSLIGKRLETGTTYEFGKVTGLQIANPAAQGQGSMWNYPVYKAGGTAQERGNRPVYKFTQYEGPDATPLPELAEGYYYGDRQRIWRENEFQDYALQPGEVLVNTAEGIRRADAGSVPRGGTVVRTYDQEQEMAKRWTDEQERLARQGEQLSELRFTTSQQTQAIQGYDLNVPSEWLKNEEEAAPLLKKLAAAGFSVRGGEGGVSIDIRMLTGTPVGVKGGSAKGQVNPGFISGLPLIRRGTNVDFNVLQEAKNVDSLMLNAIQAIPRSGENNVFDFFRTLFPEAKKRIGQYQTEGNDFTLQGLANAMYGEDAIPPEELLYQTTNRAFQYRPTKEGAEPIPFSEIDQKRNQELIEKFGVGRLQASVAVEEYTPTGRRNLRNQFVRAMMAGTNPMTGSQSTPATAREAMKLWRSTMNKNMAYDEETGVYRLYTDEKQEFLYHPKLSTFVQETSGVGSDQGNLGRSLQSQGFTELYDWYQRNKTDLYKNTPAAQAIRNISESYFSTRRVEEGMGLTPSTAETTSAPLIHIGGRGGLDPNKINERFMNLRVNQGAPTNLHSLRLMDEAIMSLAREEGAIEPGVEHANYWFAANKQGVAGGGSWEEVESAQKRLVDEGLDLAPEAHVVSRAFRGISQLLAAESTGQVDERAKEDITALQKRFVYSEQMRKKQGGIFSRYAGSALLDPGRFMVTEEGLRSMYLVGGGNVDDEREWKQFTKMMEGTTAVAARPPYPNIGTEGFPGSYNVGTIMTPWGGPRMGKQGRRLGEMLTEQIKAQGVAMPHLIMPQMYTANQGDLDLDPATLLPMALRTEAGYWKRWNPKRDTYDNWVKRISAQSSVEAQNKTFNQIFGALSSVMSPWDQQMQGYVSGLFGQGKSLLNERLARDVKHTQDLVETWNEQKTIRMGSAFNTYNRRLGATATMLGMPDTMSTRLTDSMAQYYQYSVDFSAAATAFEQMMSSGGFYNSGGGLQWGLHLGDRFEMGRTWNPTAQDANDKLVQGAIEMMAVQKGYLEDTKGQPEHVRPEGLALSWINVPQNVSPDERARILEERRARATSVFTEAIEGGPKDLDQFARMGRVSKATRGLVEEGTIGINSAAGMSILARSVGYVQGLRREGLGQTSSGVADPEKMAAYERIVASMQDEEGRGLVQIGGKGYNWEELQSLVRPHQTMYQFMVGKSSAEKSDLYTSPFNLAQTFLYAQKTGIANTANIQQLWESYGEAAGLTNPASGKIQIADPLTGQIREMSSAQDIEDMRAAYEDVSALSTEQRARTKGRITNLMGQIARSKNAEGKVHGPVHPSSLTHPLGLPKTKAVLRASRKGTQIHKYVEAYLKSDSGPAGVSDVEGHIQMQDEGGETVMDSHTDWVQTSPSGEVTVMNLKTGKTPAADYKPQLSAEAYLRGAERVGVAQIHSGTFNTIYEEERIRAESEGLSKEEFRVNVGRRAYEHAMKHQTIFSGQQIGPEVLEQSLQNYAEQRGIPLQQPSPSGTPPTGMPLPPSSGGGAPPIPPTNTGNVAAPSEEPSGGGGRGPRRFAYGRPVSSGAGMNVDQFSELLRSVGSMATLNNATILDAFDTLQQRRFGERKGLLDARGATSLYQVARGLSQELVTYSRGENEETVATVGKAGQTIQNIRQIIAEKFESEEDKQAILNAPAELGMGGVLEVARGLGEKRNVPVMQLLKADPRIQRLRNVMKPLVDASTTLVKGGNLGSVDPNVYEATDPAQKAFIQNLGSAPVDRPESDTIRNDLVSDYEVLEREVSKSGTVKKSDMPVSKSRREAIDKWVDENEKMIKGLERQTEALRNTHKNLGDVNKVLEDFSKQATPAGEKITRLGKKLADLNVRQEAEAQELGEKYKIDDLTSRPTSRQLRRMLSQATSEGEVDKIFKFAGRQFQIEGTEKDIYDYAAHPEKAGGFNLGRMARSMLGGFGLMYMQSMARTVVEPWMLGYQETNQQQQQFTNIIGQRTGGMVGMVNPEEYLARAQGTYGGGAWSAMRMAQANLYMNNPAGAGLANMATAGIGAAGLVSTLGMWAGLPAATIGSLALPAFAIGAVGSHLAGSIASANDDQRGAIAMASQVQAGTMGFTNNMGAVPVNEKQYYGGMFNQPYLGYSLDLIFGGGKQDKLVKSLEGMRQYQQGGGSDLLGYLKQQGSSESEARSLLAMYGQVQAARPEYAAVPTEGLMMANILQSQYGMTIPQGQQFGTFAAALSQSVPIEQTAMMLARTPGRNYQQQLEAAGNIMQGWYANAGSAGPSLIDIQRYQQGSEVYDALGFLAPDLGVRKGTPGRTVVTNVPVYDETQIDFSATSGTAAPPRYGKGKKKLLGYKTEEQYVPGTPDVNLTELYKEELGNLSPREKQAFLSRAGIEQTNAMLGLAFKTPDYKAYQGMTQQQMVDQLRAEVPIKMQQQELLQIQQGYYQLGNMTPDMTRFQNMSFLQMSQVQQQQRMGFSTAQSLMQGGMASTRAEEIGRAFTEMDAKQAEKYSGLMSMNPQSWAAWALQNPRDWSTMLATNSTLTGVGGQQVNPLALVAVDIKKVGGQDVMTGQAWGTSSLALPGVSSEAMAQNVWGNYAGRSDVSQGLIGAMIQGGTNGGQMYQLQVQAQYNQAQQALQWEQFNLQQRYTPQFWAIEDQQRDVSRGYQMWQLGQQERQLQMNDQFFYANAGINRKQQLMQRQWSQEDWSYQDTVRGLQWQWTQEDFQENARFMTGRQRRLAERQMGRQTTMHELEGEQIDTQRKRQQELWKLEDQRYKLQLAQHAAQTKMQQESIEKTREYYQETWKLQDQQTELSRQYWKEQQELQRKSIELSQEYANEQQRIAQTMAEFSQYAHELVAGQSLMNKDTMTQLAEALAAANKEFQNLIQNANTFGKNTSGSGGYQSGQPTNGGVTTGGSTSSGGSSSNPSGGGVGGGAPTAPPGETPPRAYGGLTVAGHRYLVGENGPELFKPFTSGEVVPNNSTNPWASEQFTSSAPTVGTQAGNTTLVIKIGDEILARKVLRIVEGEVTI